MNEEEYIYSREARFLKNDKIMADMAVKSEKERWANLLKNGVGQDMKDVLSGKKKVKLTLKERIKYKIKFYKNKLRKIFTTNEKECF